MCLWWFPNTLLHDFVTGVSLDTSSDKPTFCESCIYVNSHHQAIPEVCEGEHATTFGAEIYSNIRRSSPVKTIGGHHYFISFMNDHLCLTHIYLLCCKSEAFEAYKTRVCHRYTVGWDFPHCDRHIPTKTHKQLIPNPAKTHTHAMSMGMALGTHGLPRPFTTH